MTDADIRKLFDQNPNMTLAQLSRITGKHIQVLKRILMS